AVVDRRAVQREFDAIRTEVFSRVVEPGLLESPKALGTVIADGRGPIGAARDVIDGNNATVAAGLIVKAPHEVRAASAEDLHGGAVILRAGQVGTVQSVVGGGTQFAILQVAHQHRPLRLDRRVGAGVGGSRIGELVNAAVVHFVQAAAAAHHVPR